MKAHHPIKPIILILVLTLPCFLIINIIPDAYMKPYNSASDTYYQGLDLNKEYTYNITQFQGPLNWLDFNWSSKYNVSTNTGGQLKVNFTGFYQKNPQDTYNLFQSPIPFMDIKFFQLKNNLLELNHTFLNVSNGEVAMNLNLGYNLFKSGFLIPLNNLTYLQNQAYIQNNGYFAGKITVEETYNLISFDFQQKSGFQNTNLVYDKESGILVSAKTSAGNYSLNMFLVNYSLHSGDSFQYNVNKFGNATMWYNLTFKYKDLWETNENGTIMINYTGKYLKPMDLYNDVFPADLKRAWFGIEILYKGFYNSIPILSFDNITNREAAINMMLGFNDFQPGFFIPKINNITYLKQIIKSQSNGSAKGDLVLKQTNLTFYINFKQKGGGQETTLLYEKKTGLLLYANTKFGGYHLEMTIENYTVPNFNYNKKIPSNTKIIPSFSVPLVLGISAILTLLIIVKVIKKTKKTRT